SLDAGAPASAAIDEDTGEFNWTPAAPGSYALEVRVTDNGLPPASDSELIAVTVLNAPALFHPRRNGTQFELNWNTAPGRRYAVDYKHDLNAPAWTPLGTNTASGAALSFTNDVSLAQGFYRIRIVP